VFIHPLLQPPKTNLIMRLPRIVQRAEAASKEEKHNRIANPGIAAPAGIAKAPKKKRADKLRALAGAFTAEAQKAAPSTPIDPIALKYDVHERIGQGKNGVDVFRCTERFTGHSFAVKRVPKALIGHTIGDERPAIAALRGPQLVGTHEILEGPDSVYYILELAAGGDLFDYIATRGPCEEQRARPLFTGILAGLHQVHSIGLVHRDIKLENILLMHPDPTSTEAIRLADFEFCVASPAVGQVGSLAYSAPEALDPEQPYTASVDVWAAGVVLYAMLSASAPFDCPLEGPAATEQRIRTAQPGMDFKEACWEQVSPAAKDLINGLLHPNPAQRLSLEAAMQHPWLVGSSDNVAPKAKFSLRCTWHTKAKRWSNQSTTSSWQGAPAMLVDDQESSPLVACPLEWQPSAASARGRANSM
jgi:calcium-dependent protein kinase